MSLTFVLVNICLNIYILKSPYKIIQLKYEWDISFKLTFQ